jgi:hypothetical protein
LGDQGGARELPVHVPIEARDAAGDAEQEDGQGEDGDEIGPFGLGQRGRDEGDAAFGAAEILAEFNIDWAAGSGEAATRGVVTNSRGAVHVRAPDAQEQISGAKVQMESLDNEHFCETGDVWRLRHFVL